MDYTIIKYSLVNEYSEVIGEDIQVQKTDVIPCEGEEQVKQALLEIAEEFGYEPSNQFTSEILQELDDVIDIIPHDEIMLPSMFLE